MPKSTTEMHLATHMDQMAASNQSVNTLLSIDEFQSLLSDSNHDHLTDEIVGAMGGIDEILIEYVRITREYENEELLSGLQMRNIANIISSAPTAPSVTMWDYLYDRAKLMDNTFHFSSSDTVWHSIFVDGKVADRIVAAIFSKLMGAVVCIAFIAMLACVITAEISTRTLIGAVTAFLMESILLLFLSFAILSCNIPSLLLILTTFDFWVKLGYSVILAIASSIIHRRSETSAIWVAVVDVALALTVLIIINLSLIEGYHGNWKVSFIFGFTVSLFYSFLALILSLDMFAFNETELELFGFSMNLNEWIGSCYRVLSLFLWKQTVMAAYTRGEWCICIYLSPCIKWTDG